MWEAIVCAVVAVGAVAVAGWALISGQVSEQGVDGLFLLVVCLLAAAAFAAIPAEALRRRKLAKQEQPKEKANAAG